MKTLYSKIMILCLALAAGFFLGNTARADVTLTADDAFGTSSFNSSQHWSDGLAPHSGTNYLVASGRSLRTPENTGNYIFGGDSLTLNNGNINLKGTGNITIDDLRLYSCRIGMGQSGTAKIYGTNTVYGTAEAPSRYSGSLNRSTFVYAALQGSGEFQVERTAGESSGYFVCRLLGDNSAFTGGITVIGNEISIGINSTNSLGGELGAFRADALRMKNGGALYSITPLTLESPTRGITLDNGGVFSGTTTEHKPFTVATPVTGTGNLSIKGIQLITLNSAVTITGDIVADGGLLTIGPDFSLPSTQKIVLRNNGTLSGTTPVVNDISVEGGRINPGVIDAAGSLTVSNVYYQSGAFEFNFSSGTNADHLTIAGALTRPSTEKFVIRLTAPVANESGSFALMTVANMGDYTLADFELLCSYYNLPEGALAITGNTLYFNQARPVVFLSASGNNAGDSFTNPARWSNGELPSINNDYIVAYGYRLRTAGSTTETVPFNGNSLTMADGSDLRCKGLRVAVADLRLFHQRITHGTPPNTQYIDGNIAVLAPYDFENDGSLTRILVVESELSGTADIRFKMSVEKLPPNVYPADGVNGKFELLGANTNYTGGISVNGPHITYLTISDEINLGGNPPAFRADQLTLLNTGILAVATSVTLDDPNRGITLAGTGGILDAAGSATLSIACPVTGSSLYKRGSGTLALSGNNTHTGGTILEEGTMELRSAAALGTGPLTFGSATGCKVLVDGSSLPLGVRVADLLGTPITVEPLFTGGITPGVEIPLFLLTSATPTVTAGDITLTGVPSGYAAAVESKVVDDGGIPRTLLYTKYIIPGTILLLK